jgi:hypothetical protein
MRIQHTGDIRRGERRPFHGTVQISWPTRAGEMLTVRAKCLDLSKLGARIECEQPIEYRTNVYLNAPAHGLMGNASVRYCRRSGMRHIIGLMFSSALSEAEEGRKQLIRDTPGMEK